MAKTIKIEEVRKLPRGRKANLDAALVKTLGGVKPGTAVELDTEFGEVPADKRSSVSQNIRKHWVAANGEDGPKPSINFSPEGVPQVHAKS